MLPRVQLTRLDSSIQGTFGQIRFGEFKCYSGELSWNDNASNISCIPVGEYRCVWTYSNRFRRMMYEVVGVANRAGIRIHSANLMGDDRKGFKRQLNGCIALGERLGTIDGQKALLLSKPAIRRFEGLLRGRDFILEVN